MDARYESPEDCNRRTVLTTFAYWYFTYSYWLFFVVLHVR